MNWYEENTSRPLKGILIQSPFFLKILESSMAGTVLQKQGLAVSQYWASSGWAQLAQYLHTIGH